MSTDEASEGEPTEVEKPKARSTRGRRTSRTVAEASSKRSARAASEGGVPEPRNPRVAMWLEALAVEREGLVRRGLSDRVAQVDEQIALWSSR